MSELLEFWKRTNYHISKNDCGLFGIINLEHQVSELIKAGIPVITEHRFDLDEIHPRFYLDPKYLEANQ